LTEPLSLPTTCFLLPPGVAVGSSTLTFSDIQWVSDPKKPDEENAILHKPEDMGTWVSDHPSLKVDDQGAVQIGGAHGVQFDAMVLPGLDKYLLGAHRNSIPLFPMKRAWPLVLFEGYKSRIVVLDVNGKTIIIIVMSLPDQFDHFLARAEQVLDTVKWD
jgi:hypothetical protein